MFFLVNSSGRLGVVTEEEADTVEAVVGYKEVVGDSANILILLINFSIHVDNLLGSVCWICNSGSDNLEDKEGVEDIKVVETVLLETGKLR